MATIEGGYVYDYAGVPTNGVDAEQTLTIGGTPTGGTFSLAFDGHETADITWTAVDATLVADVQAALIALPNVGTGGVTAVAGTLSSGIGTITLTFGGNLTRTSVALISVADNSLTGTSPTVSVAETTAGVEATARGAAVGALLRDTTNGQVYINQGTALAPDWAAMAVDNGVKEYVAVLSQSGTNAPTATVIKNTIGTLTWNRVVAGGYQLSGSPFDSFFDQNKTVIIIGSPDLSTSDPSYIAQAQYSNDRTINVSTYKSGAMSDDVLSYTSIIIKVYP